MLSSKVGKTSKVVVCGMKSVGKTTILEQLIYGNVDEKTEIYPTIEDVYVANIETDRGTKEKVRFYDTAGIEHSQTSTANGDSTNQQLPRQYFGFADGYVLIYNTEKSESLEILYAIKKDIDKNKDKKETTIIVIGNQILKEGDSGQTTESETIRNASAWCAREKIRHFIVNSRDRSSLYEAFVHLASKLNPPPSKSTFPQLSMGRKTVKSESS